MKRECILCIKLSMEEMKKDGNGKIDWKEQTKTLCNHHKEYLLKKHHIRDIKELLWF